GRRHNGHRARDAPYATTPIQTPQRRPPSTHARPAADDRLPRRTVPAVPNSRSSSACAATGNAAAPHANRRSNTIVQAAGDKGAHEACPLMPALTHAPDALEEANRPPGPPHRCRHTAPPALATELDAGLSRRKPRALPPANLPLPPPAGQAVGGSLPSTS